MNQYDEQLRYRGQIQAPLNDHIPDYYQIQGYLQNPGAWVTTCVRHTEAAAREILATRTSSQNAQGRYRIVRVSSVVLDDPLERRHGEPK